ncbi:DNA cross-link repair 1A protein [Perognathus longimembris pacificus]|uniref:DNA cross-link repair 1A protein n=1 Tax=Perognathus longimembris pacificus TaxID=214514 RepID=UPI0020186022|nr:DNA cross-link repair 1A protein [Perognathus longimembris pacificus]
MLEDTFSEEDIWEYKSKRKPKSVHPDKCSENIPKATENGTDGKYQSNCKGSKKRSPENEEKTKDRGMCLGETGCQTSPASPQNSSCRDGLQQSQDKQSTPRRHCKTHKNKHVSPKIRPVYDGYCPNCQMPFSSLLGQTPQWHVFECLNSPPVSDIECPDGFLCTSTFPSHYKKYTHFLLAQKRDSKEPFLIVSPASSGNICETKPGFVCNLEERWSQHPKQTGNLGNVSNGSLLISQCPKRSQLLTDSNQKISLSANSKTPPQVPQFPEFKKDKLVGVALPLSTEEEVDNQSSTRRTSLSLPENAFDSCEISYSPLQSDEETYDVYEKLDESQQELFSTESSKDGSLEDDSSSADLESLPGSSLKDPEESCSQMNLFPTQDEYSEELYNCSVLSASSQLTSQSESSIPHNESTCTDDYFLLFAPALRGQLPLNYQTANTYPNEPQFHTSQPDKQKQVVEESAVYNQVSLPLLKRKTSKPFRSQGDHPTQRQARELPSKNSAKSACVYRKASKGMLDGKALNTEKYSSTPTKSCFQTSPSAPKCHASQPSTKVMKQMDIGVYFGLPPRRKEEKLPRESALKGTDTSLGVSPHEKRSGQCKRKAEKSLSDLEFDAKNLSKSQPSMELSGERSPRRRKRHKKSHSPQEGAHQKRWGHLSSRTEAGAVHSNADRVFVKSACGRPQRRNVRIPDLSGTGELRKRACPFYKKIPGTGFTVDAFQYGLIEGCTAYFLTHFHSDHYAGLSKSFTYPIYCSEVTGNLLKNKLHVQEQYIHSLPMDTECTVNNIKVVLLDANHCPGAVMILFCLPNGAVVLHTGDFRADPSMERSLLAAHRVHTLYLDTTYCSPEYTFPSQQEVIQFAINTAFEAVTLNPRVLVVCGTYCIGKEKVFLAIADVLGSKVGMSQEKYRTLKCLNIPEINSVITMDMCASSVHLLPMMQINIKGLQSHLKKCGGKYDQILAFRPTGWAHSNKLTSMADVTPQTKGNISIYGIPYSEHSSYLEMKRFVQWLRPQKIIPTVNVGTWRSRSTMEKYFTEWKLEAGY